MKQTLLICSFALCAAAVQARQGAWTLKDCIATGLRNNLTLKESRVEMMKSKTALAASRSRLLPVVGAGVAATDYLMQPANVTTDAPLGRDFPDDPTYQAVRGMQYSVAAALKLDLTLYDQTLLAGIKVAETVRRLSGLSYEKAAEDLTVQISNVYYLAQTSLARRALLDENIRRMEQLCAITGEMLKGGVVLEVDLTRAEINLKGLRAERDGYATMYRQQLDLLRFLLDLQPGEPMDVEPMRPGDVAAEGGGVSAELPELRLLAARGDLIQRRRGAVKAGYLPSVSLGAQLGVVGYQDKARHFFHTNEATHNWYGNSFLSLSVSVPIFDGRAKRLKMRQYDYDYRQTQLSLERLRKQLGREYSDASAQLDHNIEVYRTQRGNYRQAEEVYRVTEEKYKEGVASMTELLQDEMRLRDSQAACVQAACQCRLARLSLLRLSGRLGELSE